MSKIFLAFLCVVSVALFGCAQNSNSSGDTPKAFSFNPKEISEKISAHAKLPSQGDFKILEWLDFHDVGEETCIYRITERVTVSKLSEDSIELTYTRSSNTSQNNVAVCPAQHPEFKATEVKSWGLDRYTQMKIDDGSFDIDPEVYRKENDWVASANVVSSVEMVYRGVRCQLVQMEVTAKSGTRYIVKQYVSLDSLFLSRFEFSRTRVNSNSPANYMALTGYSVTGVGSL